jgi:hypothetical protein
MIINPSLPWLKWTAIFVDVKKKLLNIFCVRLQGPAATAPPAGAGEKAQHRQGAGRLQALLQGEDATLRPGGESDAFHLVIVLSTAISPAYSTVLIFYPVPAQMSAANI